MEKKDDAQDKAVASEPGDQVKEWMEDEEQQDFDEGQKTPKVMTQEPSKTKES